MQLKGFHPFVRPAGQVLGAVRRHLVWDLEHPCGPSTWTDEIWDGQQEGYGPLNGSNDEVLQSCGIPSTRDTSRQCHTIRNVSNEKRLLERDARPCFAPNHPHLLLKQLLQREQHRSLTSTTTTF